MSYEEFVNDFCSCILSVSRHDFTITDVSKEEVDFFIKYENFIVTKTKSKTWANEEKIQQLVYKNCNNYFKRSLLLESTPYDFYDSASMKDHIDCLKKYFLQKYKMRLPVQIEIICMYISLKCEEFQNFQAYFNNQMLFVSNYKSNVFLKTLHDYRSELNKSANKTEDLNTKAQDLQKKAEELNEKTKELDIRAQDFEKKALELDDKLKKAEKNIRKTENRSAKKMTEASVTVLGIFSAVILTFNAALSLSASVLQNINITSIYRLMLISLVIGLIAFNLIFALFYYLNVFRSKLAGSDEVELKKLGKKSLIVFWVTDIILVLLMLLVVVAWWIGIVESRNDRFEHIDETTAVSTEISSSFSDDISTEVDDEISTALSDDNTTSITSDTTIVDSCESEFGP